MSESIPNLPLVTSLLSNDRLYICRFPNLDRAITGADFAATFLAAHTHDDRYFTESEVNAAIAAAVEAAVPIGTIKEYVSTNMPSVNWVLMTGQTLTNAQTLNTVLWSRVPATWKSGANIIFPDTRGKVSVSQDTADALFDVIGEVGGSKNAVVVSHDHSIAHDHANVTSTAVSADHTHAMNFNSGTVSADHSHAYSGLTVAGGGHFHNIQRFGTGGGSYGGVDSGTSSTNNIATDAGPSHDHSYSGNTGGISANHSHNVNGSTGGISANHTHDVNLPNFTGTSGPGSGAVAGTNMNLQPYVVFPKMIKVL